MGEFHAPLANELPHVALSSAEILYLLLKGAKLFLRHLENPMAWDTAAVAHLEDLRKFSQRKAQLQCSLDEAHTVNRVPTIQAIARFCARRFRKNSLALVVADGIGAYAGQTSEFPGVEGFASISHAR